MAWSIPTIRSTHRSLKAGLSDASELFLGWSPLIYLRRPGDDGRGPGDLFVGVRHRVVEAVADGTSAAFQLTGKIPTASRSEGLGSGEVDLFLAAIVDHQFGDLATTGYYQVGVLSEAGADDSDLEHGFALAAGMPVADGVSPFAELALVLRPEQDVEAGILTLGTSYALRPSLVLDASVVVGYTPDAPDFRVQLGMTHNFGRLFGAAPR